MEMTLREYVGLNCVTRELGLGRSIRRERMLQPMEIADLWVVQLWMPLVILAWALISPVPPYLQESSIQAVMMVIRLVR